MKSSRSIHSRPENGTSLVPSAGFSGLLGARRYSTCPAGQLSITTSRGRSTAMRRWAKRLWWVRTNDSSSSISWVPLTRATPMCAQKARMASGG